MERRAFLARAAAFTAGMSVAPAIRSQPSDRFDVVVKGGTVIDPANGVHGSADVGIRAGRIAALEPEISSARAARVVDARTRLVTPGLIDFHTHIYPPRAGARLIADDAANRSAVTTWVSVGDASVRELAQFRRFAAAHSRCRVYAFVHLGRGSSEASKIASSEPEAESVEALGRLLSQYREIVLGVSVGAPAGVNRGNEDDKALQRALSAVVQAQARGRVVSASRRIGPWIDQLRPGDVLTSAFDGGQEGIVADGKVRPEILAARNRGVVINLAAGLGGLHPTSARAAIEAGFVPDVLSSGTAPDVATAQSSPRLTDVLSRFLNLGLSLEQVLAMATVNPARLINREPKLGTLELGAPADVSILQLVEGPVQFTEPSGERWQGTRALRPIGAVRAGMVLT